jgi:hypothetical protein
VREREQEGGEERVRTTILRDSAKMRTTVPPRKAELSEKRRQENKNNVGSDGLAILKESGDHPRIRSERKAVELGSVPACTPQKKDVLFKYMHYLPRFLPR